LKHRRRPIDAAPSAFGAAAAASPSTTPPIGGDSVSPSTGAPLRCSCPAAPSSPASAAGAAPTPAPAPAPAIGRLELGKGVRRHLPDSYPTGEEWRGRR
jgi:hypothetical protein